MRLDMNSFYTVAEVSSLLRVSPLTIYKYIRSRKLEVIELGGHYRIESHSLKRFIESHKLSVVNSDSKPI